MAKETVQAVRQAELNAANIEKDAAVKSEAIVSKAFEDAKLTIAAKMKEALFNAAEMKEQVQSEGAALIESAVLRAEQEILLLKEIIKSKEQDAIDLILLELV
jgi:vacuolar-type H+-ATPase subunit C/Vma6